jgi:TP901 family phage tail tape measure protein
MALRTVGVKLTADISNYVTNMRRAGESTKSFADNLNSKAASGHLDKIADRATVMGIGLAGAFGYAVKAAADFDKQMSAVSAALPDAANQMGALRQAAIQAGKDTQFSATQAAEAMTEMGKAGIHAQDILGGGLKGALNLAAAGQMGVAEAAETAASAMTQFKLSGDKLPHVADLLAAGAGKAQGSVHDMGYALNQSGLVAASFGLSIEDTTGALAEFASAGLVGSDAGTSFKTMLQAMANPTSITQKKMEELGLSFYDAQGKFKGLGGVANELKTRLGGLTDQQRQSALAQIFGSDAVRAATILYNDGSQGVDKWKNSVNDAGFAQRNAAKLTDNLAGDVERLKGSLETMAIEAGGGANSGLRLLVKLLGAAVDGIGKMNPMVLAGGTILAGLSAVILLGSAAWVKYRKAVADTRAELEKMGPAGQKASGAVGKLTSLAGSIGIWVAALEAGSAVLNSIATKSVDVDKLTASLTDLANTGKQTQGVTDVFGKDWDKLARISMFADDANHGFGKFIESVAHGTPVIGDAGLAVGNFANRLMFGTDMDQATQNMKDLDASLTNYMTTTKDATKASDLWNQVQLKSGLDAQQLIKLLPNAYKAVGDLNRAQMESRDAAKTLSPAVAAAQTATDKYTTAADAAAGAMRGETDAFTELNQAMKAEVDPVFGLFNAQRTLTKAQADAKKAQNEYTNALKAHGPKSAAAKGAADKLKVATEGVATAAVDLQGKVGDLGGTFNGKLSPSLIATFKSAGLTDKQIKILSGEFVDAKKKADKYAGDYKANASAPGAKQAKADLDKAYTAANHFAGPYVAKLMITGDKAVSKKLADMLIQQRALASGLSVSSAASAVQKDLDRNRVSRYATGGPVYGPGTSTSDSIPARLSNDEHVFTAAEVDALGGHRSVIMLRKAALAGKRIEIGDETPGFAQGGPVVMRFPTNVSKTKIPQTPAMAGPTGGGMTYPWILAAVRAAFPGLHAISTFRPGAVTLTGHRSYHAVGRAVDFPPSKPLAEWVNAHYFGRTRELITPWNSLNIWNGRRHTYTGAVWNQHNFAGGNAHDHWAMKQGGTIREPIFGVGASGRTYSFGENYQPERVVPNWQPAAGGNGGGNITIVLENHGAIGSRMELDNWITGAVDRLRAKGRI